MNLRTAEDLVTAHELVFNRQTNGEIDNKTADAMNTTLKGITYLKVKVPMEISKMLLTAKIKKVNMPFKQLPYKIED